MPPRKKQRRKPTFHDSDRLHKDLLKFHAKASTSHHGDRFTVRLYTHESTDAHVYDDVKHVWWKAHGTILVILQYFDKNSAGHRFVHWPREQIQWYQVTPARFE